jgi:hypothetical protein
METETLLSSASVPSTDAEPQIKLFVVEFEMNMEVSMSLDVTPCRRLGETLVNLYRMSRDHIPEFELWNFRMPVGRPAVRDGARRRGKLHQVIHCFTTCGRANCGRCSVTFSIKICCCFAL